MTRSESPNRGSSRDVARIWSAEGRCPRHHRAGDRPCRRHPGARVARLRRRAAGTGRPHVAQPFPSTTKFNWHYSPGADRYEIQVDDSLDLPSGRHDHRGCVHGQQRLRARGRSQDHDELLARPRRRRRRQVGLGRGPAHRPRSPCPSRPARSMVRTSSSRTTRRCCHGPLRLAPSPTRSRWPVTPTSSTGWRRSPPRRRRWCHAAPRPRRLVLARHRHEGAGPSSRSRAGSSSFWIDPLATPRSRPLGPQPNVSPT